MIDRIEAAQQHTITIAGVGTWTVRRLGLKDRLAVGGRAAQYLGAPVDQAPAALQVTALMLATLELATLQAPPGWDWNACPDDTVLGPLYDQYSAWDDSFRPPVGDPPGPVGGGT